MVLTVQIIGIALALGVLLENTACGYRSGAGVAVFYLAAFAAVGFLLVRLRRRPAPWVALLWVAAGIFAAAGVRYDSDVVHTWGTLLLCGTLLVAVYWSFVPAVPLAAFSHPVPAALLHLVARSTVAFVPLLRTIAWKDSRGIGRRIAVGVLWSVPALLVFGWLFASSDAMFEKSLGDLAPAGWPDFLSSSLRAACFSCLFAGFLGTLAMSEFRVETGEEPASHADPVALGIVLGTLNLLFASFLVVQGRYLFAGEAMRALPGLSYAEYARRGFFELLAVTTGVLGVTAGVYRAAHRHASGGTLLGLGALLILQTGGVAASAVKRLAVYTDAYGLTVARFYAAAGLFVICILLIWMLVASWRRPPLDWIGSRLAATLLLLLALLSQVDVEATVVSSHLAWAARSPSNHVDVNWLGSLSLDAAPRIAALAAAADPAQAAQARAALGEMKRRLELDPPAWQSENLARARGRRILSGIPVGSADAANGRAAPAPPT